MRTKYREKIQPHCCICEEPFWADDMVHTDTMSEQIQHAECFMWKLEYLKEMGTFEDIVNRHPRYSKIFLVMKKNLVN